MNEFVSESARIALVGLLSESAMREMRARPGFSDVARTIALGWRAPETEPERRFAMTMRDLGRFMATLLALYLHHSGGLTVTRLAALLEATDLAGPGRARAILLYMQFIGYVEQGPARGDTRLKPYVPTADMERGFGSRIRRELANIGPISPPAAALGARFDEPGVAGCYFGMMGEIWIGYMQVRKTVLAGPSLEMFSERYAGMMMLAELLAGAAADDVFPPLGPMAFSVARVARACDVSRTQVRVAFRRAQAEGFLELVGEGVALPTPLLREHLHLMIAGQIIGNEWLTGRVLLKLGEDAGG
jgi:hypothetical protein